MFCNQCGTQLQPDYNLCPRCGQRIAVASFAPAQSRLERHLHLLGVFWIVVSAIWLIPSFFFMTMSHAVHFMSPARGIFGPMVAAPLMFGLGGGFLLVAITGICVGWGLMQREPWARITAIVVGMLAMFHPPFGTALGIYTLWVLLSNDAAPRYEQAARTRTL
jgi:hypothetical protein